MELCSKICQLVDEKKDRFIQVSHQVWQAAEVGFQEYASAAALTAALREEGFTVEEGVAGIPTAFVGTFGNGHPVVGLMGEFDALSALSQQPACPEKQELLPGGNGHGCGHNALGAGSLAAAVAIKDYLLESGMAGTVKYFGCPGEETGSGKMFMARAGVFDGLDAAFSWHPSDTNAAQGTSSQANICALFQFKGRTAHAAGAPHLGRSALDACEIMNVGCNYLREHIKPNERLHYAYTDVGGTAPNVVQDHACVFYYVRSHRVPEVQALYERVVDVARGAALITGTQVEVKITDGLCDYVPNDILSQLLSDCFHQVGGPAFDEADRELAAKFQQTYSQEALTATYEKQQQTYGKGVAQQLRNASLVEEVLPYVNTGLVLGGSTDMGDVSYCVPTAQLNATCWAYGTPGHTWQITAQSASPLADKGLVAAAKAMALAGVTLLGDPELLARAQAEYQETTGGKYICPVPDTVEPMLEAL